VINRNKINKIIFNRNSQLLNVLNNIDKKSQSNFNYLCNLTIKKIIDMNKVIFYGNGGSAADSQHLSTEFVVKYKNKRRALPSIALTTDVSIISAIGNDYKFEKIFSRQLESIGLKGDISIALTTSGNSQNLIEAAKIAKYKKITTFCLSGNNGGKLKKYTDFPIIIPSNNAAITQTAQHHLGQIYFSLVDEYFYKKK
jgi:D-sedoheptulose 7-phosphate isomerase